MNATISKIPLAHLLKLYSRSDTGLRLDLCVGFLGGLCPGRDGAGGLVWQSQEPSVVVIAPQNEQYRRFATVAPPMDGNLALRDWAGNHGGTSLAAGEATC